MPKETIRYKREDITVTWKPNLCIHSWNLRPWFARRFLPQQAPLD